MKNKIGLIAMGSRENRPNWQDLIARLEPELEVDMVGVLDGLIQEEIEDRFSYRPGENYIVTEMPWDYTAHISEEKAKAEVLRLARQLFAEGTRTVLVLCTGDFDRPETEGGLFLLPEDLMFGILSGLKQKRLGFIVPEPDQIPGSVRRPEPHHQGLLSLRQHGGPGQNRGPLPGGAGGCGGDGLHGLYRGDGPDCGPGEREAGAGAPAGAAQAHQGAAGAAVRGNSRADFEQAGAL